MKFSDMVVLVAGGTGGLGRAVSLAFLEEGAKVIVTYREQKEFDVLKIEAGVGFGLTKGSDGVTLKLLLSRDFN